MIPLKLTIRGLYSYTREQTIDFSILTQAGLFGIFGPVGSGKSTILEAIAYALYGNTERINAKEGRAYNMMNLKSNEMLIDFEFKGNDQLKYRFTVTSKRNPKNFQDVKTPERKAYRSDNDKWVPIDTGLAEEITGLKYDNFKRTIIIPQGRFQEFLQLGVTERVDMLKELFNLHKFDLSDKLTSVSRKNDVELVNIGGQLSQVPAVTEELIEEKKCQRLDVEKIMLANKEEFDKKEKIRNEQEQIRKLGDSLVVQMQLLAELNERNDEMAQLKSELDDYEKLNKDFGTDIQQQNSTQNLISQYLVQIGSDEIRETELKNTLAEKEKSIGEIQIQFDKGAEVALEIEDLKKISRITGINAEIKSSEDDVGVKKIEKEILDKSLLERKSALTILEGEIARLKAGLPDLNTLHQLDAWYTKRNVISEKIEEREEREKASLKSINENEKSVLELFNNFFPTETGGNVDSVIVIAQVLEAETEKLKSEQDSISESISKLKIQQKLEEFSRNLEVGQPCPLCGSTSHPQKIVSSDIDNTLTNFENLDKEIRRKLNEVIKLEKKILEFNTINKNLKKGIEDETLQKNSLTAELDEHFTAFTWEGFDMNNKEMLDSALKEHIETSKKIKANEMKENELRKLLKEKDDKISKLSEELRSSEDDLLSLNSEKKTLLSQLQSLKPNDFIEKTSDEIKSEATEKEKSQLIVNKRYEELKKEIQDSEKKLSALSGSLEEARKTLQLFRDKYADAERKIREKLSKSEGLTVEYVREVIAKNIDLPYERLKIEDFNRKKDTLNGTIKNINNDLSGRNYDKELHEAVVKEATYLKTHIEEVNKQLGALSTEIALMEKNLVKYKDLIQRQIKLNERKEDIDTLASLFRGNQFVNFVSTTHLNNLCLSANARLMNLTRQQLGIELNDANGFAIRDYLNEGKTRSVKTLSGGQTFQASLSLALALADSIHSQNNTSENFFFLDEGFGSLDKDSLTVVFETLRSIRRENRIVGLISHVEEMQQQIESYIMVEKDENTGSTVKGSWEI